MADLHAAADLHGNAAVAPRRLFAWMALAAAALTFVVIVASAWMRHAQAGLSCADWPACYARVAEVSPDAPPGTGVRVARITHRVAATGVGALILVMLLIAWTQRPVWRAERAAASGAAAIVTGLAVLGTFTAGAKLPAVVLGNLLGGYALLTTLCAAHAVAAPATPVPRRARRWALVALACVFVQAGLGGLIGAQFATLACPDATSCGAWTWRQFVIGGAWDALRAPVVVDGVVVAPAGAAALHVLHRLWSIALAVAVLGVVQSTRQTRPGLTVGLLALLGAALSAGVAAAALQPTLAGVVFHNACAALLAALLVRVAAGRAAATDT
jgi:heme a synthase